MDTRRLYGYLMAMCHISKGEHIPLALVALLIIIIGLPYTILLFLWQWIVRAPRWKVFKWTRNTKLNAFIASHHVPHNSKYRYWTGLLLLVRVVLYATASVTVSAKPQTFPLNYKHLDWCSYCFQVYSWCKGVQENVCRSCGYSTLLKPSCFFGLQPVRFQNGHQEADRCGPHLYDHNLHPFHRNHNLSRDLC